MHQQQYPLYQSDAHMMGTYNYSFEYGSVQRADQRVNPETLLNTVSVSGYPICVTSWLKGIVQ